MASKHDYTSCTTIENQTKKTLSIQTQPTPQYLAQCHPQSQSPLFDKIPAELRNEIFRLALQQYDDPETTYSPSDYWYRPSHLARHIVSTTLLLTCRRIWLEANHWPMLQAVHSFWYDGDDRKPAWSRHASADRFDAEDEQAKRLFKSLTPTQLSRLRHVHIFAQMYWLERDLHRSLLPVLERHLPALDTFAVTIRHSDWWNWEIDDRLRLNAAWLWRLLGSAAMEAVGEVRLELETLEWKMAQLRTIVEGLKTAGKVSGDKWELVEPFEETTWSGPVDLGGRVQSVYAGRRQLDYHAVILNWRKVQRGHAVAKLKRRWEGEGSLLKLVEPAKRAMVVKSHRAWESDEDDFEDSDWHGDSFDEDEGSDDDHSSSDEVDENE